MRRNCPHCGQEQVIADEEIQSPWIFTRCHGCENLSILRKEGGPKPAAAKPAAPKLSVASPALPERNVAPERKAAPRTPSPAAREIRPEAVLGAFASASRERPEAFRPPVFFEEEKELALPSYYSPYAADSEKVVFKAPPATPAFLKRARTEAPQESALEPLAKAIREEARPVAEPVALKTEPGLPELPELDFDAIAEDELWSAPESVSTPAGAPERKAPPPAGGGSSFKRRQKLIGAGTLLIGIGFGLLVLRPQPKAPEPEPEQIPTVAPQPPAFVPVKPAPVAVPPPQPPSPADLASAASARAPSGFWIVAVSGAKTSLRAGPGKEHRILGEVETGSRWKVRRWDGEWFQVEPEDLGPGTLGIGWIRNDLVKPVGNGGSFE